MIILEWKYALRKKILGTHYFKNNINVSDINLGDTFLFEGSLEKATGSTTNNIFSYHNYLLSKKNLLGLYYK